LAEMLVPIVNINEVPEVGMQEPMDMETVSLADDGDGLAEEPGTPVHCVQPDPPVTTRRRTRTKVASGDSSQNRLLEARLQFYKMENKRQEEYHNRKMEESRQAAIRHRIRAQVDALEGKMIRQRALDEAAIRRNLNSFLPDAEDIGPNISVPVLTEEQKRLLDFDDTKTRIILMLNFCCLRKDNFYFLLYSIGNSAKSV